MQALIKNLTTSEKQAVKNQLLETNIPCKIANLYIAQPDISQEEIARHLDISSATCAKSTTQAKELVYEIIKKENKTAYDDIFLVRSLIMRGLYDHAHKLILKLEERYSQKQWYSLLDTLYHESFRIAYNSSNIKELEVLNEKAKANLDKYRVYSELDKQLLLDMAKCEKQDVKPKDIANYLTHLEMLYKRCQRIGHYVLEFNALHCLYEIHVNYTNDFDKVFEVVGKIEVIVKGNKEKMNEPTYANMLTQVAFPYCIYESEEKPENYFSYLFSSFQNSNNHFLLSELLLHFALYYFAKKQYNKLKEMYGYLSDYANEKSNQYKISFVACLLFYSQKDYRKFHQYKNDFYRLGVNSRDALQCDIMLRYLEIVILINSKEYETSLSKTEATEKFLKRNCSITKYEADKQVFTAFRNKVKGKKIEPKSPLSFRFNNYILAELL